MDQHSPEYKSYLGSVDWWIKRKKVLVRAKNICESCRKAKATSVHHLNYDHLGDEPLTDLLAVCSPCHEKADRTRKAETESNRYYARVDSFARKKYGEYWEEDIGWELASEDFEAWLERQQDEQ